MLFKNEKKERKRNGKPKIQVEERFSPRRDIAKLQN